MNSLLCSGVSKYLGHFPEGLVELHILIDALDCPALGHPATVRATAGMGAPTPPKAVFLAPVQHDKKTVGSPSIPSCTNKHRRATRGFRGAFPRQSRHRQARG